MVVWWRMHYMGTRKESGDECERAKVSHLCPTLCGPMDWSPTGSSVHGILQARILEWVSIRSGDIEVLYIKW